MMQKEYYQHDPKNVLLERWKLRAVVQRVSNGRVKTDSRLISEIAQGLVVLLGIGEEDSSEDAEYIAVKIANLRIFSDTEEKLNLSVRDINGEVLVVSQFTLMGDCRKGRRPSFAKAADPEEAIKLYKLVIEKLRKGGLSVKEGQFQEKMTVKIINDGPVTILLDSKRVF